MSKVLVLYYSSYGHIETMAQAVAEGARSAGASVDVKRVPETVPQEIAQSAHFKLDQAAPVATVAELQGPSGDAAGGIDGGGIFSARCAACHQATGAGLPGVFPPLAGSEWVQGDSQTLAAAVLHGIQGQLTVKGQVYSGVMPSFAAQLSDAEMAAVLTHIRKSWGNHAAPIGVDVVARVRKATATRTEAYQGEAELHQLKLTP